MYGCESFKEEYKPGVVESKWLKRVFELSEKK
jgi:hypothetical protein